MPMRAPAWPDSMDSASISTESGAANSSSIGVDHAHRPTHERDRHADRRARPSRHDREGAGRRRAIGSTETSRPRRCARRRTRTATPPGSRAHRGSARRPRPARGWPCCCRRAAARQNGSAALRSMVMPMTPSAAISSSAISRGTVHPAGRLLATMVGEQRLLAERSLASMLLKARASRPVSSSPCTSATASRSPSAARSAAICTLCSGSRINRVMHQLATVITSRATTPRAIPKMRASDDASWNRSIASTRDCSARSANCDASRP